MKKKDVEEMIAGEIVRMGLYVDKHDRDIKAEINGIKRHLNLTGTAGKSRLEKESLEFMRFMREFFPNILQTVKGDYQGPKTERFPPRKIDYSDSPIHMEACTCWTDRGGGNISGINDPNCPFHHPKGSLRPDLPLNARVAKALGREVKFIKMSIDKEDSRGEWLIVQVKHFRELGIESHDYETIPDYPNDLTAAMGALEEYCEKKKNYSICYYPDFSKTLRISIWNLGSGGLSEINVNCPLPQAICEAIVKHSEANNG